MHCIHTHTYTLAHAHTHTHTHTHTQELMDDQIEDEPMPFMLSAKREVLAGMKRYEVQRQENIKELVYTERNHVHRLKIMRYVSQGSK